MAYLGNVVIPASPNLGLRLSTLNLRPNCGIWNSLGGESLAIFREKNWVAEPRPTLSRQDAILIVLIVMFFMVTILSFLN